MNSVIFYVTTTITSMILAFITLFAPSAPPAATVRLPPAHGVLDYQLGGAYPPATNVQIVDRDRTATPFPGRYNICYVNAFQTQPDASESFASRHPDLVLHGAGGVPLIDPGWPDEYLFDTSTPSKRAQLAGIVGGWIDGCAISGFQAVEADNLDSYLRSKGQLTATNALAFATLLVQRAHLKGLAIGQKNGATLASAGKRAGFDFAVTEECQVYGECAS